jgi:hypothetical protein
MNDELMFKAYCEGQMYGPFSFSTIPSLLIAKITHGHKVDIMRFSGIIDDNKARIYEGDIVNYVTGLPKRYVNCVVRFGEYQTYTKITVVGDTDHNDDAGEVENHIGFYLEDGNKKRPIGSVWIQKVGTIYDNPELIQSL